MPSPMSANDEAAQLSNEEIETLYDIVRRAQSLPEPPFRALFTSYDRVRQERGFQDDGGNCFMFLLRMQEDKDEDKDEDAKEEGLVERFTRVLGKMGIQIEIDPEGEGVEVTENLGNVLGNVDSREERTDALGRRSRRGSFDSFFDGVADKVPGSEYVQALPLRPRRGSGTASDIGERREQRRTRSDSAARPHLHGQLPIRGRVNEYRNKRMASESVASRRRRSGSVSSRGSLRIHRDGHTETQRFGDYDEDDSEQTDSFDRSHIQIPGVNAPIPSAGEEEEQDYVLPEALYRPSDTQVARDADTFDYHRIVARTRTYIRRWRDHAMESVERRGEMEPTATTFDRNILLRASLDAWRIGLQTKRQAVETERFFERLEKRAGKARNLFLLTKALTHWAKSAEDQVQRTSTAKRHLLRTKYFNAWRDITAVNELKIQHFILDKFLYKWRSRTAAIRDQQDLAVGLYEHNIVYRLYWQWFWRFGDRRAPFLYRNRLARDTIQKWAEIVNILKEREAWAVDQRDRHIARVALGRLREKTANARAMEEKAREFRQMSSLSSAFYPLRRRAKLAPLGTQFKTSVDERLLRSTFGIWHRDTQLSRRAKQVDRMRIVRNAFTAWNDRLRIKLVEDRIDERVQLECLYKWSLASRMSLLRRIHDHRLKQSAFSQWLLKTQTRELTLEEAEQRFANFKRRQLLRTSLQKLENTTVQRKDQEYLALSTYEPKLKRRLFTKLLETHDHVQQMNGWAERANYYVTAHNAIKRWHKATEFARRNRRREAYATMRRTVKMNLVRRTFSVWREKAVQIATQERQANEMVEKRIQKISTAMLINWRDQTITLRQMETQATQKHIARLMASVLATWSDKSQALQALDNQAIALRHESTEIAASSCLKKLGWRLWTVQRQEKNALALHQRNFEKHLRAIIRFWWEQTSERLAQRPLSPTPSSRHRGGPGRRDDEYDGNQDGQEDEQGDAGGEDAEGVLEEAGDETRALESWTAFDEHALGLSNTNLDLSFSISPQRRPAHVLPLRPHTQPPSSAIPPPPSVMRPISEIPDLETEEEPGFWTSTPMPMVKPGYLKTPSKRSVARAKRPELPASPEKRLGAAAGMGIDRSVAGIASAPPGPGYTAPRGVGGVTSFERRLREGGFAGARNRGGRGRGRVGFGDVTEV